MTVADVQERYRLWLGFALGPRHRRYFDLMEAFEQDAKAVFAAASEKSLPPVVKEDIRGELYKRANERFIDRCLNRLQKLDVQAISCAMPDYPHLLKEIYDPPSALYYRGTLRGDMPLPIAVVGSRKPTDYGKRVTLQLAQELAESGCCIISGLAYGIDCLAAEGALKAENSEYPTLAVLGGGPDVVYPEQNRSTYERILSRGGAVISEQMPGRQPIKQFFPSRNRIISGIARGVVVVEAGEKSGSIITAESALEQNRDVFAVPGRIGDVSSVGTNALLRAGVAKIVLSVEDILEEYGRKRNGAAIQPNIKEMNLNFEQELIVRLLQADERSFDELCELTSFLPAQLNSCLTELEFSGIIKQSPGRLYSL